MWARSVAQRLVRPVGSKLQARSASLSTAGGGSPTFEAAVEHCSALTKTTEPDLWLCHAVLPKAKQPAGFVLRAVNIETARIADAVQDGAAAQLRMQWWKEGILDALRGGGGAGGNAAKAPNSEIVSARSQPVLLALAQIAREQRETAGSVPLSKTWFLKLMDARMRAVTETHVAPRTLAEVEQYSEATYSSLLYLLCEALDAGDEGTMHAASHLGKALGMCVMLRATGHFVQRREIHLPMDLTAKHGLSEEALLRGEQQDALVNVVHEIAEAAYNHLLHARDLTDSVSQAGRGGLRMAVTVDVFLDRLQRAGFNVFDSRVVNYAHESRMRIGSQLVQKVFRNTY